MKSLIKKILNEETNNKKKVISILNSLFSKELKKIQDSCETYEDGEGLPDDIADSTCYYIHNIEKIKVYDIEEIPERDVLNVHINVDIDSMKFFDVIDELYDLKQRVSKLFGQRIMLIEGEVNNLYDGDW